MTRTVYLNGEYFLENEAKISIFDRGFLMADAVYEVTSVLDGKLIDFKGHAERLNRSLNELDLKNPISYEELLEVHRELVRIIILMKDWFISRFLAELHLIETSYFPTQMRQIQR
jgi:D-alanine transaminase